MRNEAIMNKADINIECREEPESRRFSGGTMWFCPCIFFGEIGSEAISAGGYARENLNRMDIHISD